jgi:hypothetical protein
MRIKIFNKRMIISLAVLATAVTVISMDARAGGPLYINGNTGQAIRWARNEVRGGRLNSQTVDSAGRVMYHVDLGDLGPLSNAQATALTDRIFGEYTAIPGASIEYVNAGRIIDPDTNTAVDVNGTNVGKFLDDRFPTFQNPIIFDSNGAVIRALGGDSLVLGLAGVLTFTPDESAVSEAIVVINGESLTRGLIGTTSLLGVFTHEFGHFAGPLDHQQINGSIADPSTRSILPPAGFTSAQAYDLYTPFMETMYPFIFDPPAGSQIGAQFGDTGFFIATLDMDTKNALANLYPTADYGAQNGSIEGRVVIRTGGGDIPVSGINVIARRISQGGYAPPSGTLAFLSSPIPTDGDGVPQLPPDQGVTDSLATISSAVTGLDFGNGTYRIQGLPPGNYLVQFQQIDARFTGGSSIGPLFEQLPLPVVEEFFNGPNSSSNSASVFTSVAVGAGQVTTGIDIILNGFSSVTPTAVNEKEPNEKVKKAQKLTTLPANITAAASSTDTSLLKIDFGGGVSDKVEDLYRITVDTDGFYAITLEATSGSGDLDLWLFTSAVNKKKTSLSDPNLIALGATESSNEFIIVRLAPGTYIVGVSAFAGSQNYRLRVIPSA